MTTALPTAFDVVLPPWLGARLARGETVLEQPEARARLVIELARENVRHGSGGPFAAAVFERSSGRLVAAAVNSVVPAALSIAHAEVLALSLAQRRLGVFDLGAAGLPQHEIISSTEPCLMCLGAVLWSGVHRLVCCSRDEDARAIGFDEGPKPERWETQFAVRGIEVVRDVLRESAAAVLAEYRARGGVIYSPRRGVG